MKRKRGSLTVETAMVLPLYMIMTIALISIIEMMSTYIKMEYAVHETAKEIACVSCLTEDFEIGGLGVTETVVRALLYENYGIKELENTIIDQKLLGIHLFRSDILDEDEAVDLIVTYQTEPFINVLGFDKITLCNRSRIHAWVGYGDSEENEKSEYVYITEKGSVYHTNPNCTYLHVSILTADKDEIDDLRNDDGKKYERCKLCFDEEAFENGCPIYVTKRGEAYHTSLSCYGLKRTVYKVRLSEVGDRKECSRCQEYKKGEKKEDDSDDNTGYLLPDNGDSFDN